MISCFCSTHLPNANAVQDKLRLALIMSQTLTQLHRVIGLHYFLPLFWLLARKFDFGRNLTSTMSLTRNLSVTQTNMEQSIEKEWVRNENDPHFYLYSISSCYCSTKITCAFILPFPMFFLSFWDQFSFINVYGYFTWVIQILKRFCIRIIQSPFNSWHLLIESEVMKVIIKHQIQFFGSITPGTKLQ